MQQGPTIPVSSISVPLTILADPISISPDLAQWIASRLIGR